MKLQYFVIIELSSDSKQKQAYWLGKISSISRAVEGIYWCCGFCLFLFCVDLVFSLLMLWFLSTSVKDCETLWLPWYVRWHWQSWKACQPCCPNQCTGSDLTCNCLRMITDSNRQFDTSVPPGSKCLRSDIRHTKRWVIGIKHAKYVPTKNRRVWIDINFS